MGDHILDNLDAETEYITSYIKFLYSGHQIVHEKILTRTVLEFKESEIEALNFSINKLQKDKEALVTVVWFQSLLITM